MDWASLIQAGAALASQYGKQQQGRAQGAALQANVQGNQDQNAISRYIAMQNAQNSAANTDLARQQFTQSSRGRNARDAMIGALLGNFSPTGNVSGGLARGLSTPEARMAMSELNRQGLEAQLTPPSFQGGQILTAPKLTPLPNVGGNGVLNSLAALAQLAGAGYAAYKHPDYSTPPEDGQ